MSKKPLTHRTGFRAFILAVAALAGLILTVTCLEFLYLYLTPDDNNGWREVLTSLKVLTSPNFKDFLFAPKTGTKILLEVSNEIDNTKSGYTGILSLDSVKYFIALLIAIVPTYFIWIFRNQNKMLEIENARKDTNLKDFQQLQNWLGDKDTSPEKRLSAVHQLGAFFRGEFGEQFQIAAYEMLHALWVNQYADIDDELNLMIDFAIPSIELSEEYRQLIFDKTDKSFPHAIVAVVFGDGGRTLQALERRRRSKNSNSPSLTGGRDWRGVIIKGGLKLSKVNFPGINFSGSKLANANLFRANFSFASLNYADLGYTNLRRAKLNQANLSGSSLSGSKLNNGKLVWANLTGADLSSAKLIGAKLSSAKLSGARLTVADLIDADLTRANLSGANLRDADLSGANLSDAELFGADFTRANLTRANLFDANLDGLNIDGAYILNLRNYSSGKKVSYMRSLKGCKNIDKAIIGYFALGRSKTIRVNRQKTNQLRAEFGLKAITKKELEKLQNQILENLQFQIMKKRGKKYSYPEENENSIVMLIFKRWLFWARVYYDERSFRLKK